MSILWLNETKRAKINLWKNRATLEMLRVNSYKNENYYFLMERFNLPKDIVLLISSFVFSERMKNLHVEYFQYVKAACRSYLPVVESGGRHRTIITARYFNLPYLHMVCGEYDGTYSPTISLVLMENYMLIRGSRSIGIIAYRIYLENYGTSNLEFI